MRKPKTAGKGWRFMRPEEKPTSRLGDQLFSIQHERWIDTARCGQATAGQIMAEFKYVLAYRRKLK